MSDETAARMRAGLNTDPEDDNMIVWSGDLRALLDERDRMIEHHAKQAQDIMTLSAELARLRAPVTEDEAGEAVDRLEKFGAVREVRDQAADLITRQAAEIERLRERNEAMSDQIYDSISGWQAREIEARATKAEASLREAVDRINQLIAALGSTSMGQIDGARRSALAFLAKMENKP